VKGGAAPSVYPESCEVQVERRTLPHEDESAAADFRQALAGLAERRPEIQGDLTVDLYRPGSDVSPEHALVHDLTRALEAEGESPRVEGMTAWVDAAYLNRAGIPAVCFGPGSIAQAHSADEWVEERQLLVAQRVMERLLGIRD
jgi:acetylornithine deacetylase